MSANSIAMAAVDSDLIRRVSALAQKELIYDETKANSSYGRMIANGGMPNQLVWAVAVATEAAYESALVSGRGAPGHDSDVITDGDITSAIVANWPPDPNAPTGPSV